MNTITGKVIRALRLHYNYKQDYVAAKIGISTKTFANVETGRVGLDIEKLYKISKVFRLPSRDLYQIIIEIYENPEDNYRLPNAIKNVLKNFNDEISTEDDEDKSA